MGDIPLRINKKVKSRLEDVWHKIYEMAVMNCPVDTMTLVGTIRMITGLDAYGSSAMGGGAPSGGYGVSMFNGTITVGDSTVNPKNRKTSAEYAALVHDGNATASGGWVPARPFLTDALAYYESELLEAIDEALRDEGTK
jgi:hypothetical protein